MNMKIPYDKKLHFICCFIITIALFPLIRWWSIGVAIAAGFAKEAYDWRDYGLFSWDDIKADMLGVVAGMMLIGIITKLIQI